MSDTLNVLLGAALALAATFLVETWKLRRASQAAALMIARELDFHRARLSMVIWLDTLADAAYEMKFPAMMWSAYSSALLTGAPLQRAEPILHWYATMAVVGNVLGRQVAADGPHLTGPDRDLLDEALANAEQAASYLAENGLFTRHPLRRSPTLFPPVASRS